MRSDGKRPDGLTQIAWQAGKCMTLDFTVIDTMAESYIQATTSSGGGAEEGTANQKELKYAGAGSHSYFRSYSV